MRLSYKILWFEDDVSFFEELDRQNVIRHLDAKGFDTEIIRMGGNEDLQDVLREAQRADLIVMDYGLEESHFGDQIITEIRNGSVNTQVVFYSAREVGELRRIVFEKELDGVFFGSRNDITQDVLPIIDSTIRKVLDLENSRGLVMAEMGELDKLMNEIIFDLHNASDERKEFIRQKMKDRLDGYLKSLSKQLGEFDTLEVEELVEHLDSSKRLDAMLSICKELKLTTHRTQLRVFHKQVLEPRNHLAHGVAKETEDGWVFTHRGEDYIYDEESSTELRNGFRAFRKSLEEFRQDVRELLSAVKDPHGS